MLLKKYANRRLYDTAASRYVTLDEVAERIRGGEEVIVIDAADGSDLTQATLTQLILESRGAAKLLPVPLLHQLVRLGDDALAEFFNRWISWALEFYVAGRQSAGWFNQWNPMQNLPFFQGGGVPWGWLAGRDPRSGPPSAVPPSQAVGPGPGMGQAGGPGVPPGMVPNSPMGPLGPMGPMGPGMPPPPMGPMPVANDEDVARLRRELEELRAGIKGRKRGPRKKTPPAAE